MHAAIKSTMICGCTSWQPPHHNFGKLQEDEIFGKFEIYIEFWTLESIEVWHSAIGRF